MNNQPEYEEEVKKIHDRDFTHNWVSSSTFLFYLHLVCIVGFTIGSCYILYTKRFYKTNVPIH